MISLKSIVTKKLLNYFFINPRESLYVNEIARKLQLDKRNLVKKMQELEKEGILKNQIRGNLKFYSINQNYPLYNEYRQIVIKTLGFEENLRETLKGADNIKKAYIYGSYAKDKMDVHSDIDLLIIGNHDITPLQRKLNKVQKEINREINVVNMSQSELMKRIKNKDPFIKEVFRRKNIRVV